MQLREWLTEHDVRLDRVISSEIDPMEPEESWKCEIRGFYCPSGMRPAVFLLDANGHPNDVTAFASNPSDAYHTAVHMLRGLKVNVVYRDRDETLTFPEDLTV